MTENYKQFGSVIGSVLCNKDLSEGDYRWEELAPLFDRHNLTPVLNACISNNKINSSVSSEVNNKSLKLLSIQINQKHEIEQLRALFDEKGIDNLFVKGSVTGDRYPKAEFRTMGDIDVLYKINQHELLKESLLGFGYSNYQEGRKNDAFSKGKYISLETHRQLVPSDSRFYEWCNGIWDRCSLIDGYSHSYAMTIEDEIVFNIIHFAIHFLEGGAGARFLCDVYVYSHLEYDRQYVEKELEGLGLLEFYKTVIGVENYWFDDSGVDNDLYDRVIDYVMGGGVFGSAANAQALRVEDGGTRYLLRHFFPSYKEMCSLYPWLKGKAVLLPFAWCKRGLNTIIHKKGAVVRSVAAAQKVDKDRINHIRNLYNDCGLNMKLRD